MFNKVKGTYDVLPNEVNNWHFLENKIAKIMKKYNYMEMRTPIMEYSNVIHRESEHSDMVVKETYNFKDKGDRDVTLRPEGTAGIARSYVENKLYAQTDLLKVYYVGQMFRYERPQKGRYRQFMQFGMEALGAKSPLLDAEVIKMAGEFIESLGLKNVVVEINSIGDNESRKTYQSALVEYLTPFYQELSEESKLRLDKNPLRILDSKDQTDQKIIVNAPKPIEYLSVEAANYFNKVKEYLEAFKVDYIINDKLVRGLDYYSHTVFEVTANIKDFGAQNVLGGGGRYEQLITELGGPKTSAIGFAFGMERLLHAIEAEQIDTSISNPLDAYIITFSETEKLYATKVLNLLREHDIFADIDFENKSFKSQLKKAIKLEASFIIIIGEEELNTNKVTIKNTKTEQQETIDFNKIVSYMKEEMK